MSIKRVIATSLLPRYAQGTLPAFLRGVVKDALDHDPELATRYHLLRRLERAAHASGTDVTAAQEDLIFSGLAAALDRQPAPEASGLRLPVLTSALAAAAALTFVVIAPGPPGESPTDIGLQARGLEDTAPLGVRVRCVDAAGTRVLDDATAGARQTVSALACKDDGLLAFSLTNLGTATRYVFVVGVDEAGATVFLPPFLPSAQAVPVAAGAVDVVLDRLAPMPIVAGDGLTLHVLVDDEPFSGGAVETRLQMAAVAAVPLSSLGRLPVDVDLQARMNLYRRP